MRSRNIRCDILYWTPMTRRLLKRFSETRRRHPLSNQERSLAEAIHDEQVLLSPIADLSDLKIDTTHLNLYQLRDILKLRLLNAPDPAPHIWWSPSASSGACRWTRTWCSTCAFCPNPYWKPDLRDFSGLDCPGAGLSRATAEVETLYNDIRDYLCEVVAAFCRNNRSYVTVAMVVPVVITARSIWPIAWVANSRTCSRRPDPSTAISDARFVSTRTDSMPAQRSPSSTSWACTPVRRPVSVGVAGRYPASVRVGRSGESPVDGKSNSWRS